jgi:diadenosine tetraphosphate (Ap4A) HIT family hydrolase
MSEPAVCGICELHAALGLKPQREAAAGRDDHAALTDPAASADPVPADPAASANPDSADPGVPEAADLLIGRFGPWLLRHHPLPSPLLGWLLLDTVRHVGGAADFNAVEAAGFGGMLQRSSALVRELSGCERVYAIAFGEGARHVHLHLIPRHAADPASEAWRVADLYRAVLQGERAPADPQAVARLVAQARALSEGWRTF